MAQRITLQVSFNDPKAARTLRKIWRAKRYTAEGTTDATAKSVSLSTRAYQDSTLREMVLENVPNSMSDTPVRMKYVGDVAFDMIAHADPDPRGRFTEHLLRWYVASGFSFQELRQVTNELKQWGKLIKSSTTSYYQFQQDIIKESAA
tara:strand:+ start:2099 stop:2542 length:444 start_codon:yes stop_codon:yes gene_type:complete